MFSGFLYKLLLLLKKENIRVEVKDFRTESPNVDITEYLPEFEYNEHQKESLIKMKKIGKGIIQMPTSSGKSSIIFSYIKAMNIPALILVNRIGLASQLQKNFGKNMGICIGNKLEKNFHMVSTIKSVNKLNIKKFKILIIDECHHASSDSYLEFLLVNNFDFIFSFSATPFTKDKYKNALIEQHLGNIIYKSNLTDLIENKVIAKAKIKFINIKCIPTLDWPSCYIKNIVENEERNNKIKELVDENKQTLILIKNISHGEKLKKMIDDSVFVSGINSNEEREEVIKNFEDKKIKTIISSNIFNEGISIISINQLIIASGGKSFIETLQKVGRSLRSSPEKERTGVEIWDFEDQGNRFSEYHSYLRKKTYIEEGFEVL